MTNLEATAADVRQLDYEARRQRDNANAFRRMWEWAENAGALEHVAQFRVDSTGAEVQLRGFSAMQKLLSGYVAKWENNSSGRTYRIRHGGGFIITAYDFSDAQATEGVTQL